MLNLGRTRIHLATKPADFRKSIDGLSGEVRRVLDGDPTSGHVFVFHNRRRTALKLLWWDRGGFCLLYKRLEKGRFRLPQFHEEAVGVVLSRAELEALVEGLQLVRLQPGARWEPPGIDLAKARLAHYVAGVDKDQEIAALRALLAQRDAELAAVESAVSRLQREIARLKQERLGTSRERFEPSAAQLALWGKDRPEAVEPEPKRKRVAKPHGRRKPPPELPEEVVACTVPEDTVCAECGDALKTFGEDEAERIEYVPGYFRRLRIVREKCACPEHPAAGVVTAEGPDFVIERGLPGNGLVAKVVVDKYADHIPLDRQVRRFRRQGVDLPLSTVCDWVQQAAQPASVLVRAMLAELTAGAWLQSDATGFKVLEGRRNKPHRGHLYTWANTDRVVYTYAREGTGDHPVQILEPFQGTLVADGGSAFNRAASKPGVVRAGCWAHARRKFWEARDTDPRHVHHALETIREVFQLERAFRELSPADRARQRRATTWPIVQAFQAWCQALSLSEPPKSPLAKAAGYVLRQWDGLVVFIDDGNIPAHNNLSELLLRQPVVGRKNWLFAGSEGGAVTAATWFSLIGSCMVNAIDPWLYLSEVLPQLNAWPANRVLELEPAAWRARRLSQRA